MRMFKSWKMWQAPGLLVMTDARLLQAFSSSKRKCRHDLTTILRFRTWMPLPAAAIKQPHFSERRRLY